MTGCHSLIGCSKCRLHITTAGVHFNHCIVCHHIWSVLFLCHQLPQVVGTAESIGGPWRIAACIEQRGVCRILWLKTEPFHLQYTKQLCGRDPRVWNSLSANIHCASISLQNFARRPDIFV